MLPLSPLLGRLFLSCLFFSHGAFSFVVTPDRQAVTTTKALSPVSLRRTTSSTSWLQASIDNHNDKDSSTNSVNDKNRRILWTKQAIKVASLAIGVTGLVSLTRPAWAGEAKSRTKGYKVQKSELEWKQMLSPIQYDILRNGGTERPGFSILEVEKRPGTFSCAGCGTPLFSSADKFNSGTGWPSFARGLPDVEVEQVNPIAASLSGAELRCGTCGGHLGDVFQDGFLFVGTEAFKTGQRYCIDGAALIFYPDGDVDNKPLRGDTPKPKEMPSWLETPKITPNETKS